MNNFEYLGHNLNPLKITYTGLERFKCNKCGIIILKSFDGMWKYSAANKIDFGINFKREHKILTCDETIIKILIE